MYILLYIYMIYVYILIYVYASDTPHEQRKFTPRDMISMPFVGVMVFPTELANVLRKGWFPHNLKES